MRVLVLALALISATTASATPRTTPFKSAGGAFFAISVPNMAESVRWYSQTLGLTVTMEIPGTPAVTVMEGDGVMVEILHDPFARPASTQQHGMFKGGFTVKHFAATLDSLRARGATFAFGPYPAQGGQRANVILRDNAGNLIQIFGDEGRD